MGDSLLAAELAAEAGKVLLRLRDGAKESGLSGEALKNAGDKAAQDYLAAALGRLCPEDAVLSEEAADSAARLSNHRVWIIDPLDGTREYSEFREDFAVHVALWERGSLTAGAVALPAHGTVYSTETHRKMLQTVHGHLRLAVSRSRPSILVDQVAQTLGSRLVPMGSAGYKICAVLRGEADAYLHSGGQYEWDSAAPVAVARSYGLHTSRIDGSDLKYNQLDPYLPDLLVCRKEHAQLILDTIATNLSHNNHQ
ncbi:3'(2'),5'-bisphosphate nucleotidase CysQ [Glutamicibacter ardleyensis]|uniref:3'(2'),5'-bisphosphate nucleotidase CysQ n=1 Tax=Glutamicibacter ardleyensis TaxID=225894 RepID=UPI003FD2E865